MINYDRILYNIVKNKLTVNNINEFNEVVKFLSEKIEKNPIINKTKKLLEFLNNLSVNILNVKLSENQTVNDMLNTVFNDENLSILQTCSNTLLTSNISGNINNPLSNDTDNNEKVIPTDTHTIISYIVQNNSYKINYDRLFDIEQLDNKTINEFKTDLDNIIKNKDICNIITFLLKYVPLLYKSELSNDKCQELMLPVYICSAITSSKNRLTISVLNYVDDYISINRVENDYDLLSIIKNTISNNSENHKLLDSDNVQDKNGNIILNTFKKQPLVIKKSDKMPIPSSVDTVGGFLNAFEGSSNVENVRTKITKDIYISWNTKLVNILHDVIVFNNTILPFYISLNNALNGEDDTVWELSYEQNTINITGDKLRFILNLKSAKYNKTQTVSMFIKNIIDVYEKNGTIFDINKHNTYKEKILHIIQTVNGEILDKLKYIASIQLIYNKPIYLNKGKNEKTTFISLLATIVDLKNVSTLKQMGLGNFGTSVSNIENMRDGVMYDIKEIINKRINTGNTCNIVENDIKKTSELFFSNMSDIFKSGTTDFQKLEDFAKNKKIWLNECTGFIVINTLYNALCNVSASDEFLTTLFTMLIPNAFIKLK